MLQVITRNDRPSSPPFAFFIFFHAGPHSLLTILVTAEKVNTLPKQAAIPCQNLSPVTTGLCGVFADSFSRCSKDSL
jgi:hypothetical protein